MSGMVIITTTTSTVEEARRITRQLVERGLVACGNIVPAVESTYQWDGVHHDHEALILLHTTRHHAESVVAVIEELHSYDTPQALVLPVEFALQRYAQWVSSATQTPTSAH